MPGKVSILYQISPVIRGIKRDRVKGLSRPKGNEFSMPIEITTFGRWIKNNSAFKREENR
jgi:hypothetical protein